MSHALGSAAVAAQVDSIEYRRACRWFAALFVAGLSTVALVNFFVDPYDLYPADLLRPITFASHRESVRLLRDARPAPAILILGTSRVGKLEPRYVEARLGKPAFNANLNAATAETLLAYLRYAEEVLPRPPETLFLGLDASSFSNATGVDEQLINTRELARQVPEFVGFRERAPVWMRLLNFYQLEGSVASLRMAVDGAYPEPLFRFAPDGLRVWRDEQSGAVRAAYIEQSLGELLEEQTRAYAEFDSLSPARLAAFDEIVGLATRAGTKIVAFTTPIYPALRDALQRRQNYADRERDLRRFVQRRAEEEGFVFVDLADITTYGGDPEDWLDTLHHGEATGRLMIDRLLAASDF